MTAIAHLLREPAEHLGEDHWAVTAPPQPIGDLFDDHLRPASIGKSDVR
jgi:hypothetical protein